MRKTRSRRSVLACWPSPRLRSRTHPGQEPRQTCRLKSTTARAEFVPIASRVSVKERPPITKPPAGPSPTRLPGTREQPGTAGCIRAFFQLPSADGHSLHEDTGVGTTGAEGMLRQSRPLAQAHVLPALRGISAELREQLRRLQAGLQLQRGEQAVLQVIARVLIRSSCALARWERS